MQPIKSKGTVLQQKIATVYTTVAGIFTMKFGEMKAGSITLKPPLDQETAGIPKLASGYTDFGTATGNGYFDPGLAGHQALEALLTEPAEQDWQVVWSDTAATTWQFIGSGFGMTVTADQTDAVTFDFSIEVAGDLDFTT